MTAEDYFASEDYQRTQSREPWRAQYGGDIQHTFRPGQSLEQQEKREPQLTEPWTPPYGSDPPKTSRPGRQQQSNNEPWRQTPGRDVERNFRPGNKQLGQQGQQPGEQQAQPGGQQPQPGGQQQARTEDPNRNGEQVQPQFKPDWDRFKAQPREQPQKRTRPGAPAKEGERQSDAPDQHYEGKVYKPVGKVNGIPVNANGEFLSQHYHLMKEDTDIGLEHRLPYGGNLVSGGIGGLIGKYVVSPAGNYLAGWTPIDKPVTIAERAARWWQLNLNEPMWKSHELATVTTNINKSIDATKKVAEKNTKLIAKATERIEALKPGAAAGEAAAVKHLSRWTEILRVSEARNEFLPKLANASMVPADRITGVKTALERHAYLMEPAQGGKGLFRPKEVAIFEEMQKGAKQLADRNAQAAKPVTGIGRFATGPIGAFVKGAGMAGTFMIADHYLDQIFFGKNHGAGLGDTRLTDGYWLLGKINKSGVPVPKNTWFAGEDNRVRVNTNSLLVPAAFIMGKGSTLRTFGIGAGALVAGKVIDKYFSDSLPPTQHDRVSNYFHQTNLEALGLGVAALLPTKKNMTKLALLGTVYGLGRLYNIATGDPPKAVKNDAMGLLAADGSERSAASMMAALNRFKDLGIKENQEPALNFYREDWLRPNRKFNDPLSGHRGTVILAGAFAESRLEHGTRVAKQDKPTYILAGRDLDFAGHAYRNVLIARASIDRAKQITEQRIGQQSNGTEVQRAEIGDLDKIRPAIDGIESRIIGEHDMHGIVAELAQYNKGHKQETLRFLREIRDSIARNRKATYPEYVAKLFRDEAVLTLAMARQQLESGNPDHARKLLHGTDQGRQEKYNDGSMRGYDGALDCIRMAAQIAPNNPDMQHLQAIAADLQKEIPGAITAKQQDTRFDPLQVRRGQ